MKKKLIALIAWFFITVHAGAVPACPEPFDVTQPDGTILTLHMIGDEYYHWTETSDNQVVVQSEEGYYEYATILNNEIVPSGIKAVNRLGASGLATRSSLPNREQLVGLMMNKRTAIIAEMDSIRRAEELLDPSMNTRASNISLTKGNQKVLCILMEFPDRRFTKTKSDFQNMWNQTGYNVEGSRGSVKDFYYENSYGQMNVTATVVGPYMAEHNSSYYAAQDKNSISESNVQDLVTEAIQAAKDDIQFKNFDINEDKFVDAIHIVFAGYAAEVNKNVGLIWSHKWQLQNAVWQGLYRARKYFITSELAGDSGNLIAPIGTVCHEYGHQLGAPDYYCHNDNNKYPGTGRWDVMGSGSWNGFNRDGRCPAHHNPYTKAYIFDWVTPTVISSSVSNTIYTLTPVHNTTSIYRINTSTTNEFFLLENKKAVTNSFNSHVSPPGGLIIYHVHSDIENAILNKTVNDYHPQKCYVIDAHATLEPTNDPASYGTLGYESAYPFGRKIYFTSTSIPSAKSWAGIATGVDLCYIQRDGDNIKFVVNPRINGWDILSSEGSYSIPNIPENAKIKWTYTFTPSSNSTDHMSGNAINFVNGDTTASVTVRRGTYQYVEPTLPDPETGIVPMPLPMIKLFAGTVVLKATITYAQYSYVTTKTITLPDITNILPPIDHLDGITDTIIEVATTADVENNSITTYRLRHANPISVDNSVVHIEKLSDAGDDYIPYDGNYTLEVWHDQFGLVEQIEDNTPYLYLDCGDMPTGVYQMILIVNEQIVAQSKLLKL